jgi:hypothetical protein
LEGVLRVPRDAMESTGAMEEGGCKAALDRANEAEVFDGWHAKMSLAEGIGL